VHNRPTACAFPAAETTNSKNKFLILAKSSVRVSVSCADALSHEHFLELLALQRHAFAAFHATSAMQCYNAFSQTGGTMEQWNMRRNNKSNTKHEGRPRNIRFVSHLEGA